MDGEPNKRIAQRLGLTEGTVKPAHRRAVAACRARNRTEAVVRGQDISRGIAQALRRGRAAAPLLLEWTARNLDLTSRRADMETANPRLRPQ